MASNALIGKTITKGKNKGKIKVYYSHWGEANAHTAGENKPQPPEQDLDFEQIVKDKKEFGKIIDYVFCEAVWLDGECFRPIYIHSSRYMMSRKGKWKREGQGILLRARTGNELRKWLDLNAGIGLIDDLTDLNPKDKIKLMINFVVKKTDEQDIPEFSPMGYKVKYQDMRTLFDQLKQSQERGGENRPKSQMQDL